MKRLASKLTYANVMATVAVFIALGGASYAATHLPRNSVGPRQLKAGAVTPAKVSRAARQQLRGQAGPPGPSNAYYTVNNDLVSGSKKISLSVPAGSYVASASMYATNRTANNDRLSCSLESAADKAHDGSVAINVPKAPPETLFTYVRPAAETVFSIGGNGGTITFNCENVEGTGVLEFYQARITAVAVGSLTG